APGGLKAGLKARSATPSRQTDRDSPKAAPSTFRRTSPRLFADAKILPARNVKGLTVAAKVVSGAGRRSPAAVGRAVVLSTRPSLRSQRTKAFSPVARSPTKASSAP